MKTLGKSPLNLLLFISLSTVLILSAPATAQLLLIDTPSTASAELVCTGKAYGLDYKYTFSDQNGADLNLQAVITFQDEILSDSSGTALYTSTDVLKMRELETVQESYYVFAPDKESETELIAISEDLRSMAKSSPDPISDAGNFVVLRCRGSL